MSGSVPRDTRPWFELAAILAVCALVYFWKLGPANGDGFAFTEGFRAQPGWAMLRGESGWLVPELFDRDYLRKPPGINWLMAGSAWVFGATEWSARLVSAVASVAMCVVSWSFARRWFGCGLWAGLACALTPVFWESGRAAEIEATNHLLAMLAALLIVDLGVFKRTGWGDRAAWLAWAVLCAALVKGPAAGAVVAGAVVACGLAGGRGALRAPGVWVGLGCGVVAAGAALGMFAWEASRVAEHAVTQSPGEFLWERERLLGVLTLPVSAVAQAAPGAIAWLFPWGPFAREEAGWDESARARLRVARALALTALCAIALYVLLGVSNPRYAIPAAVVGPAAVGYVERGWRGAYGPFRRMWTRVACLGSPLVMGSALLVGSVVYIGTVEASRRATSGRAFGQRVGERLVELGAGRVYAGQVVDSRPETLIEVERAGIDARWVSSPAELALRLDRGSWALVRAGELERLREQMALDVEMEGRVHEYTFALVHKAD